MTDDPKPPGEGGIPPIPRPRRSKRKRDRQRDWLRPSQATPTLASPAASRMVVVGALILSALGVAVWITGRAPVVTEKVFLNPATVHTGTSAEAVAAAEEAESEKRAFAEKLFGPEFFDVKDRTDFAEEPQWRHALEVMANLDPRFVEENLQFSLNLHYAEVMENPETFRGQFVRMRGIADFQAVKLETPIAGRIDWFRGQIQDPDDTERVYFSLLDHPPDFRRMYEPVDVDGVFYKVVRFEAKSGRVLELPWIIGRTVVVRDVKEEGTSVGLGLGIMTAFLALVFAIVYLVRRGGRPGSVSGVAPADFRGMFERKLGEERPKDPPSPSGGGD